MKRISSRLTFFQKRVSPMIWFGFVGAFVVFVLPGATHNRGSLPMLIMFATVAVISYFVMKKLVWNVVDEVWDAGDALVVRNKGQEERIALSDIMNVSYFQFGYPQRATLQLRRPSSFGEEIAFSAPNSFNQFDPNPDIKDLIQRIDAARMRAR